MPIVVVRKAAKLPAFIDIAPPPALRREHAIGQRHLARFSRAFMRVSRSIYDRTTLRALRAAIEEGIAGRATVEDIVGVVEWFNPADPLASKKWELLGAALERAYTEIIEDAGQGEIDAHGWPIRFTVTKQAISVPVNPFSIAWLTLKAASLVQEISDQQRSLLRQIILDGFEEGQRPDVILEEIEMVVGLLVAERQAVRNRRGLLIRRAQAKAKAQRATEVGQARLLERLLGDPLEKAVDRYAKLTLRRRARRIARTETIDAYAQGLDDSWELAKQEGFIDDTVLQDWIELTASPRTCKICRGLGRSAPVPLGEPFLSEFIGEVRRPPAHPH